MKICGLKLTHDASVAVIEDGHLIFSTEMEKVGNNPRYSIMEKSDEIVQVLASEGIDPKEIKHWVIDGWKNAKIDRHWNLTVNNYNQWEYDPKSDSDCLSRINRKHPSRLPFIPSYNSYQHMSGHIFGAYAMSPWSATKERVAIISWDGGQCPILHFIDPKDTHQELVLVDRLHDFYGVIYGIMRYYWGPYKERGLISSRGNPARKKGHTLYGGYDMPGKIMSYIGIGKPMPAVVNFCWSIYETMEKRGLVGWGYEQNGIFEHEFCRSIHTAVTRDGIFGDLLDPDVLLAIHTFLEQLLVKRLVERGWLVKGMPLIFVGGSALNIKWNTALKECGHCSDVWVPPVCNDTGSAIGAAVCEQIRYTGEFNLNWSVFSGPKIVGNPSLWGHWRREKCSPFEIGYFLSRGAPVIVLSGRAEIGPRALGHRSILMPATKIENKDYLNTIKSRESFRPVAPICLSRYAADFFSDVSDSGDPYMLFDHEVLPTNKHLIPAVVHLDGTARLQTMSNRICPDTTSIIEGYMLCSGIPLLCNTSANRLGAGFFPDVESAMKWSDENDGPKHIYSEDVLYRKD